jgi:hypothetical protein
MSKAIRSSRASERRRIHRRIAAQPPQPASSLPLRSRRLRRTRPAATATPKPPTPASSARTTNTAPACRDPRKARERPALTPSNMLTAQRRLSCSMADRVDVLLSAQRPTSSRLQRSSHRTRDSFQLSQIDGSCDHSFRRPFSRVYPRVRAAVFALPAGSWLLAPSISARNGRNAI